MTRAQTRESSTCLKFATPKCRVCCLLYAVQNKNHQNGSSYDPAIGAPVAKLVDGILRQCEPRVSQFELSSMLPVLHQTR